MIRHQQRYSTCWKTALNIRHLVEAMDEEDISFHEQTTQNLVIESGLKDIKSVKRNYNNTTTSEHAEGDRTEENRADGVYRRLDNGRRKRGRNVM
jgi:hypothetical protein